MDQLPANAPRTLSGRIAALSCMTCFLVLLLVLTGLFTSMTLGSSTPLCADAVVSSNLAFTAGGLSLVILSSLVLYTLVAVCGSFLCLRATEIALGLPLSLRDEQANEPPAHSYHPQGGSAAGQFDTGRPTLNATGEAAAGTGEAAAESTPDDSSRLLTDIEAGDEYAAAGASTPARSGLDAGATTSSSDAARESEETSGDEAVDAAMLVASIPVAHVVARPDETKTVGMLQRLLTSHTCVALVFTVFFVVHGFSTVYRYADPVQMEKLDSCNGFVRTVTEIYLWVQMGAFILVALFFCCLVPCVICLLFVLSTVLDNASPSWLSLSEAPDSVERTEAPTGTRGAPVPAPGSHDAASSSRHNSGFDAFGSTAGIDEHTASLTRRLATGGALAPSRAAAASGSGAQQSAPTVLPPV